MLLASVRAPFSTSPITGEDSVLRRRRIGVDSVVGDELFEAICILGHALCLPALLPLDDAALDDDITAEFDVRSLQRVG